MKDLNDEVGNEAARLLAQLNGGGKALSATVLRGNFHTAQPLEVILILGYTQRDMISCLEVYIVRP